MAVETRLDFKVNDKATSAISKINASMAGFSKTLLKVGGGIAAIAGITGVGSLLYMGKRALEVGDKIDKLTIRLNSSAKALSEYRFVASQAGIDFDELTKSWNKMDVAIVDASRGIGKGAWALDQLNLSIKDMLKMRPEQQFEAIATAMDKLDPSARGAVSAAIFGTERGRGVLTLLQGGSAAIQAKRAEASASGYTLTRAETSGIASFNDAVDKLQGIVFNFVTHLTAKLAPAMQRLVTKINEMIINTGIFKPGAFEYLVYLIEELVRRVIPNIAINFMRHMQNFVVSSSKQINILSKISAGFSNVFSHKSAMGIMPAAAFIEGYSKGGGVALPEDFNMLQGLSDLTGLKSFSEFTAGKNFDSVADVPEVKRDPGRSRGFMDGFRGQIETIQDKLNELYGTMEKKGAAVAEMTAKAMGQSFQSFFFDIIERRIKKMSEIFNEFFKSIASSIAKILSDQLAAQLIGGIFKVGAGSVASSAATSSAATGATMVSPQASISTVGRSKATTVEVVNQSGQAVRGKTAYTREDPGRVVIGVVLEAINNNTMNSRDILRGALA